MDQDRIFLLGDQANSGNSRENRTYDTLVVSFKYTYV